jgi:hypothetical protein
VRIHDGRAVGTLTSSARHHELGPIGLAVLRRTTPVEDLLVDDEGGQVAAAQEPLVAAEGMSVDRPPTRGPVMRGLGPTGVGRSGVGTPGSGSPG